MSKDYHEQLYQLGLEVNELSEQFHTIENKLKKKLAEWNKINDIIKAEFDSTKDDNSNHGGKSNNYGGK